MAQQRQAERESRRSEGRQEERKALPVYSCKYWTGSGQLEIAVFENEGDNGRKQYATSVKKTYKVGDEFKESKTFFPEELPLVASALNIAFAAIQSIKDENRA